LAGDDVFRELVREGEVEEDVAPHRQDPGGRAAKPAGHFRGEDRAKNSDLGRQSPLGYKRLQAIFLRSEAKDPELSARHLSLRAVERLDGDVESVNLGQRAVIDERER